MRFAPDLPGRRQAQRERADLVNAHGEMYFHSSGQYRESLLLAEPTATKSLSIEQCSGVEKDLHDQLIQYLDVHRERQLDRPVIMLDFGGMAGLSMVRIAARPNISKYVATGEMAFVVSNLGFNMQAEFAKDPEDRLEFLAPDERLFISTFRHLVHYVNGDASDLLRSSIALPDGRQVPLKGQVDVVHERMALAHGFKNDLDIPRLGKLVSDIGQLWIGTREQQLMDAGQVDLQHTETMMADRKAAHRQGLTNLAELGLKPDPDSEAMRYAIYRKGR